MRKVSLLFLAFLLTGIIKAQFLTVSASVLSNVSCYGGSNGTITCSPTGGTTPYTYNWSPGSETTQTVSGLIARTYTILVTDYVGLTASASTTVTQPTALSVSVSAKFGSVCPGSSDSIFANSGGGTIPYNYAWTAPFSDITCPSCASTLCYPYGAAYIVTAVNDLNGCTASASLSITVRPFPYVTIAGGLNPIAPGRSDTLVASAIGATSYLWSNSATTSSTIVSPVVSTSYSVVATNIYGCYDSARYVVDTNSVGTGKTSTSPIRIVPTVNITTGSFSSLDSVVWFSFIPSDSNNQIICTSAYLGMPMAHTHRLTLFSNSMQMLVDEPMPDITGANQIRIDISHLHVGSTYYVRASRNPAHTNMPGCNPSASGECNPFMRWDFQMCFRTVPVFVPNDSGNEAPAVSQLYYESRGQIPDLNNIPRFDIKAYTNNAKPAVFCSDSAVSFVYGSIDTLQRVDMVLTGTGVQPSQPVFKMEEDSNAGYLNYFLGYVPNGVPKVEGYSRLVYKNVYPNVDMQVYSNNVGTKLYFVCNPGMGTGGVGGNPANIELQFKGASSVSVTGSGGLKVVTELGTLSFAPGYAYTDSAGIIKPKAWQPYFIAVNSNTVRFNTGTFNSSEPLIIRMDRGHKAVGSHPSIDNLDWSTYFGGVDGQDVFNDVCSDAAGNVYATGYTQSAHYPVTNGVVQDSLDDALDATLAKFSNANAHDSLEWATYYGGGGEGTAAYGVALDISGNVYVTGFTQSDDLPRASRPSSPNNYVQATRIAHGLNSNAFITMFSNDGTKTYWATYYGSGKGRGGEWGYHIAVDGNSNVYVVGGGVSAYVNSGFPIYRSPKPGAYNDSTYGTGFILEFNASNPSAGITREWATRIGDSTRDSIPSTYIYGCAVDARNNFYVTGYATGWGYTSPAPLTFQYTLGSDNAVVTKFNFNNHIIWSSYYGGSGDGFNDGDDGRAITVDHNGNAYITGNTTSDSSYGIGIQTKRLGSGFFVRSNLSGADGYIAEFDSVGNQKWGTYFSGGGLAGQAITTDSYNNLYLTGWTGTGTMILPASNPAGVYSQRTYVSGNTSNDGFVAAFSTPNTNPDYVWGTDFGNNIATGICITHYTGHNWLYIVGERGSGYTPLVFPAGSYQQDTFYYNPLGREGTSFISQFDINPIIGPAGINTINTLIGEVNVYPNPTNQDVTIRFHSSQDQNVEFMLYNLMGEMVYEKQVAEQAGTTNQEINMSLFPNGIYLLKVNEGSKYMTQKIIKQN